MSTHIEYNIKEVKKAIIIMLKAIDYVVIVAINLNNYQEKYDRSKL